MSNWLRVWCQQCYGRGEVTPGNLTSITEPCRACEGIGWRYVTRWMVMVQAPR